MPDRELSQPRDLRLGKRDRSVDLLHRARPGPRGRRVAGDNTGRDRRRRYPGQRRERSGVGTGPVRGRPVQPGPDLPGRRRRARDAAVRRPGRQHRDPGRAQPGLEAGPGHRRRRRARAAGQLSRRAAPGGLVRRPAVAGPDPEPARDADHLGRRHPAGRPHGAYAGLPVPRRCVYQRWQHGRARSPGPARPARYSPPAPLAARPVPVDAGPRRSAAHAPERTGWAGLGGGCAQRAGAQDGAGGHAGLGR